MTRFNLTVPFTQRWKEAILEAIAHRREVPAVSTFDCAACGLCRTLNDGIMNCYQCAIGETFADCEKDRFGWCGGYATLMLNAHPDEKKRIAYLDKFERAVRRKKVVER